MPPPLEAVEATACGGVVAAEAGWPPGQALNAGSFSEEEAVDMRLVLVVVAVAVASTRCS